MSEDVLGLHGFKVAVWQPDSSEPKVDLFAVFFFGGGQDMEMLCVLDTWLDTRTRTRTRTVEKR